MRLSKFLVTAAAAGLIAFAASAQDQDQDQEAPAKGTGLSDLEATVDQLLDEETEPSSSESRTSEIEAESPAQERPAERTTDEPPAAEEVPAEESTTSETSEAAEPTPQQREEEPARATPLAQPETRPAPPLSAAEAAAVERNAERGRLLIAIARAGILATQDMLTRVSDPDGAGIAGWIAQPEGNAMTVTFYANGEAGPEAVYRASVLGGRVVSREVHLAGQRPALTPVQARMAAARAATDGLNNQSCNDQPFNVLVVPPASTEAPIDVYQTTPPAGRAAFPLGGHFRSTIAADGSVAETRAFANGCVTIAAPPASAGAPSRPIGVTHLLDPMPTEMHVFLSQLIGRPLLVATGEPQRVWFVTPERIVEVRQ